MTTTKATPTRTTPRRPARVLAALALALGLSAAPAAALLAAPAPAAGQTTLAAGVIALCERCTM